MLPLPFPLLFALAFPLGDALVPVDGAEKLSDVCDFAARDVVMPDPERVAVWAGEGIVADRGGCCTEGGVGGRPVEGVTKSVESGGPESSKVAFSRGVRNM